MRIYSLLSLLILTIVRAQADYTFNAGGELNLGAGSSEFAPFYLYSNNHGKITQSKNVQLDLWAADSLDISKRFDFSWGVEVLGGYANKADYRKWDSYSKEWTVNPQGPASIWLQQLYAEVKWRSLFLSVGLKDRNSCFVDQNLSSGDLLWSGNSRAIPEARIGFIDYQDIPFTKKWVQIDACLSYGKFIDTKYIRNHFDYYTGKMNPGSFWTYKRISLRSNPTKPFMFQFGFQMAGVFGGYTDYYSDGEFKESVNNYGGFKDFFLMILPIDSHTHEAYKTGDHKGSWDIAARYHLKGGETLRAYTQWFWEDGSSLLKENGFDGLWGLEFKLGRRWWISGAVAEYLDLTNQCGPNNYLPGYNNQGGGTLPYTNHGHDSYYNNAYYRSYVNYGMLMGTPMVPGTIFNTGLINKLMINDDWIQYFRVRGFHIAIEGSLGPNFDYIVKYSHRKAWGNSGTSALIYPIEADSFMARVGYLLPQVPGLTVSASFALDHGIIPSNAIGGMISVNYEIPVSIKKNQ